MTALFAETALLPDGWAAQVRLEIDAAGDLAAVEAGASAAGAERLAGVVLPGMPNVHSHAFQRAMAGLAERLAPGEASFWTWREVMYRFLERIGPEELRAIAAQLYVEMLEAGYTAVGEFHYLHHQPDGRRLCRSGRAVAGRSSRRTRATGIGLTHLPVLYLAGGFGGLPPEPGQRRFLHDLDGFAAAAREPERRASRASPICGSASRPIRCARCRTRRCAPRSACWTGSTRARRSTSTSPSRRGRCATASPGAAQRPVEHLLEVAPVGPRWCLVHATHMDDEETAALRASGAVAGLCPTTEANLGDGLFELAAFLAAGGRFGIGSDSHVSVSPVEELRWLEYGQRVTRLRRLVAASEDEPHCGARLWRAALAGGAQALGRRIGQLAPGHRADLVTHRPRPPAARRAQRRPPARQPGVRRQRQPGARRHGRRPLAGPGRPPSGARAHRRRLPPDHRHADLTVRQPGVALGAEPGSLAGQARE